MLGERPGGLEVLHADGRNSSIRRGGQAPESVFPAIEKPRQGSSG
jgi:hypothetical protein